MRRLALIWLISSACGEAPPASVAPAAYVAPATCATCHPAEAARWRGSHHARAMEVATPDSVRGDFAGASADGARFEREGGAFVIDDGRARHRVRYTFGVEPLQQYLIEQPGGRLEVYPLGWDTERAAWLRVPSEDVPPRYQTWNT